MASTTALTDDVAQIIYDLIDEIGSEIDLHYEREGLPAAAPGIMRMRKAADLLRASGRDVPEVCEHVFERYRMTMS